MVRVCNRHDDVGAASGVGRESCGYDASGAAQRRHRRRAPELDGWRRAFHACPDARARHHAGRVRRFRRCACEPQRIAARAVNALAIGRLSTDILILGAGGAGLFAALHAQQADPSLAITVAVKGLLGKCGCTRMVQGGYNVALGAGDSVERHFMDTVEGGAWLPDQDLVWTLVTGAVERVRELENELGCFFDRNPDGTLHQKAFAGQSFDRTVHKGDLTGIEIMNRLAEQVWARGIDRLEEHRAVEFVRNADGASVAGVLLIDM